MATNPYLLPELQELARSLGMQGVGGSSPSMQPPTARAGFKLITLPDGRMIEVPENPTADERRDLFVSLASEFPDEYGELLDEYRDLGGYTAEFFKGIPRGLASGAINIAQGAVGLVTPGIDTDAEKSLAALQGYIEQDSAVAADPVYRDTYAAKLGAGLGSFATFALPGAAARLLGANPLGAATKYTTFGMAGASGAGEQAARIMEQRELGKEISAGREIAALIPGFGIGLTEAYPVEKLFKKSMAFDPAKGSALRNIFARIGKGDQVAGTLYDDMARLMGGALKQGGIEGLQEAIAGAAQDTVSRVVYDPDIEIGGSMMDDLLVGGGVGALADVIVDAMGGRRTVANEAYRNREEALRRKIIDDRKAKQITEANKNAAQDQVITTPPPSTQPSSPFDGIYNVSLVSNPDRFISVPVFTQQGRTFAYDPSSNNYFDLTENIANGENISDVIAVEMGGGAGAITPSKETDRRLASAAIRKQVEVTKETSTPAFSVESLQDDIANNRLTALSENVNVIPVPMIGEVDPETGQATTSFVLVDLNTGRPMVDFSKTDEEGGVQAVFPDLNSAYKEMREINERKVAISTTGILNSLGIVPSRGAINLAVKIGKPENRLISGGFISSFLPTEKRFGLKTGYTPENAKRLMKPAAFNEMMQNASQLNDPGDTLSSIIPNVLEVDPQKRTVTADKLKQLGRTKNLNIDPESKAFMDFAKYWTGTESWTDMSNGQRLYLMSRISELSPFQNRTAFPNVLPRRYSRDKFERAIAFMATADQAGKSPAVSVSDIQRNLNVGKTSAQQIFDDLIFSGRVKTVSRDKIQLLKSEEQFQQELQEAAEQTDAPLELPVKKEAPLTPEAQEQADQNAERTVEAIEQGADPVNEAVAEQFSNVLTAALNKAGLSNLVKVRAETSKAQSEIGKKLPSNVPAWFDPINREIVVRMPDALNRPNVTEAEIVDYANQMLNHEVIHAMREADLITEAEWNTLRNFVRNTKLNKELLKDDPLIGNFKGDSLLESVRIRYANQKLSEERLLEEAIAEAYRLWNKHGGKFAAGKPQSIFKKILNYIKSFASAFKQSGATNAEQIFSAIASGQIGQRTPGLSVFNPSADAAIRSLRRSDIEDTKVRQQVRKEGKPGGVKKFGAPKPSGESAPEISAANRQRVNEVVDFQIENTAPGYVPRYNPNAPEAATLAAIEFENDGREGEMPQFALALSIKNINNEDVDSNTIQEAMDRHARIKGEDNRTFFEKALDLLDNGLSDFFRRFRYEVVDRGNEIRRIESELIGTENEINLRAEVKASAALGWLDRVQGILGSMMRNGGIRWVKGDKMVTRDADLALDKLAGYHEIDTSVPGLLPIFEKLQDGTVPNGMRQFKLYAMFKRIQGFRTRADIARQKLEELGDQVTPEDRRKFELAIEMEKKARLINNPKNEEISSVIEEIESKYPEVAEAHQQYQKWNRTLIEFANDTQILTDDMAQMWAEWADYFPFYKELEDSIVKGNGYKDKSSLFRSDFLFEELSKDAKDLQDADPFEMIIKNATGILYAGLRNMAALRIMRDAVAVNEARLIDGKNPRKQANLIRKNGGFVQTVLQDGQELLYEISDELLYESMMNFGDSALDAVTKILAVPSGVLREMVTRDPGFILANTMRDSVSAWVTSGVGYIPIIDSFRMWNSDELGNLVLQGIAGGYDSVRDPKDIRKYVENQYRLMGVDTRSNTQSNAVVLRRLWDTLGGLSQKSDAATRARVYREVLKNTGSEAQARLAAIDVINFSRRGANPIWRSITASIPFLNARVQGLDKIYTTLSGRYSPYDGITDPEMSRQAIMKRAWQRMGTLTAMTGLYFFMMQDNEDYKLARREVRENNYLISTGIPGVSVKIPISYEIGMFSKAIPEIFMNLMAGNLDARGARDSIVAQVSNVTNVDLLGFQIFKPLIDIAQNQDSFTKGEIVPYWFGEGVDRVQQFNDRTTKISRDLAKVLSVAGLNVSPMWLDYAVGGYGGTLGTTLLLTADIGWKLAKGEKTAGTTSDWTDINNVPVVRRFLIDSGTRGTRYQQEFYELRAEVRKAVGTLNKIKDDGRVSEYMTYQAIKSDLIDVRKAVNSIDQYLKRYRNYREQIIKSDMPADQKRAAIRELEFDKNIRLSVVPELRERANLEIKPVSGVLESIGLPL